MKTKIKDEDLKRAAAEGMDAFIGVFTDAYRAETGGELTAETMPLLTGEQHTLLAYQILRDELMEGGFCQLIQNGYGGKGRKVSPDRDMGGARSRRRNDRILIIAIVAAALAIAALGYGYYCDLRAARMESEYYAGPESETANPDMENIETPNE